MVLFDCNIDLIYDVIYLLSGEDYPCTSFIALSYLECPCSWDNTSGCDLPECSNNLDTNGLCEADSELPDGNSNYNINNCISSYDVFKCSRGKNSSFP